MDTDFATAQDGQSLPLLARKLRTMELYANALAHSLNERFIAVVSEGKYIIYNTVFA